MGSPVNNDEGESHSLDGCITNRSRIDEQCSSSGPSSPYTTPSQEASTPSLMITTRRSRASLSTTNVGGQQRLRRCCYLVCSFFLLQHVLLPMMSGIGDSGGGSCSNYGSSKGCSGRSSLIFVSAQFLDDIEARKKKTERTVVVSRGIVDTTMPGPIYATDNNVIINPESSIFLLPETLPPIVKDCNFVGEVIIPHASSIDIHDRFYGIAKLMLESAIMTIDHINTYRCGVHISAGNYSLRLVTYGDNSDADKIQAITSYIHNPQLYPYPTPNFLTAGYSSTMTQHVTPIAQENERIVVTAGSARTSIYADNPYIFGMLPASAARFYWAFVAAAKNKGAQSVAFLTEAGTSACNGVEEYAIEYNMTLKAGITVDDNPTRGVFDDVAKNISKLDPDVMITCVYEPINCAHWIRAMRDIGWSPRAQIFAICMGFQEMEEEAGTDVNYMSGVMFWNKVLPEVPDAVLGWTPLEFDHNFAIASFQNSSYHPPAQSAAISILVQAMEQGDTVTDTAVVRDIMAKGTFPTVYSEDTAFDENGQATVPSLFLQYDGKGSLHILFPEEKRSTEVEEFEFKYPMPTWDNRDCVLRSSCERGTSGNGTSTRFITTGTCDDEGMCVCTPPSVPIGRGPTAACKRIPKEDYTLVSRPLIYVGYGLVAAQGLLSTFILAWTWRNREQYVVKVSQPAFLGLIAGGCFVMALSILPMTVEAKYRNEQDPITRQPDGKETDGIRGVDAACMASVWLVAVGFVILYSALFAKIWRVKKILHSAATFRRRKITVQDVLSIMAALLALEGGIVLAWQLTSPLTWQREVIERDLDYFPIKSVGKCRPTNPRLSTLYTVLLMLLNVGCLFYALVLSYMTRKVPTDLSEGTWITASVISTFQILLLAGPVLVIASNDTDSSFFVKSMIVFLVSFASTILIFGPKLYRHYIEKSGSSGAPPTSSNASTTTSTNSRARNHHASTGSLPPFQANTSMFRPSGGAIHVTGISNSRLSGPGMVNRRSMEATLNALSGANGAVGLTRQESRRPAFASEGGLVRFEGSRTSTASEGLGTTTVSEKSDVDTDGGEDSHATC